MNFQQYVSLKNEKLMNDRSLGETILGEGMKSPQEFMGEIINPFKIP